MSMTNHIHILLGVCADEYRRPPIAHTMSQVVKIVSKRIGTTIWQKSFHDHIIRNREDYEEHLRYIYENLMRWAMMSYMQKNRGETGDIVEEYLRMFYIKATATRLIDDSMYPEIVLCEFIDANDTRHKIIEKWPVVSYEKFENIFPKDCFIGCTVVETKFESYIVNTEQPWDIESEKGKTIFEIHKNLLVEMND